MSPSRQPSSSQSAGAGHRPPHAVRLSSLIFQLLVSYPCGANRLAQVLLCNSLQEAAPANDEPYGHHDVKDRCRCRDNTHRAKLPENHTNITLSGQNGLTINGSSGSAALCLITQEWTRRISRLTGSAATGEPGDAPVTPTLGGSTRSFERNSCA